MLCPACGATVADGQKFCAGCERPLVAPGRTAAPSAADSGERLLADGCVSHNHFHFYANVIDVSLARAEWDVACRYCAKLEAYAAPEPLPWTDFVIARGKTLALHGRGERSGELAESLRQLRAQASQAEINDALPAIEAAIAGFG